MTREALKQTIDLLIKLGVTEFMVGNYGNFDRLCASVLKEMKKDFENELCRVSDTLTY